LQEGPDNYRLRLGLLKTHAYLEKWRLQLVWLRFQKYLFCPWIPILCT
jgi:hypothetical protein